MPRIGKQLSRELLQAFRVVAVCAVFAARVALLTVEEQGCVLELTVVRRPALGGREQHTLVPLGEELPVLAGPFQVRHTAGRL